MAGHIVFQNIAITNIIGEINITNDRDYNTSPYIGGTGSNTNFVSELGRVISFKSIVPYYDEINDDGTVKTTPPLTVFKNLANTYRSKTGVLTSNSHYGLKGNYMITKFEVSEDTGNNFTIEWEFTEVLQFNKVKKTFRVWGSASTSTAKQSTTATKTSGTKLDEGTKILLKNCRTLSVSNKVLACNKYLQKFMQSLGYYKNYKVDGIFGLVTKSELQKLQKANKLKTTGVYDAATKTYFQKKYKYP